MTVVVPTSVADDFHDDHSFESFIDADAIAEKHGGSANDGQLCSNSEPPSLASHHLARLDSSSAPANMQGSLPNTPKLAHSFSFGSTGQSNGMTAPESGLQNLSFDWDDLSSHSLSVSSAPSSHGDFASSFAFDSFGPDSGVNPWPTHTAGRRSFDGGISSNPLMSIPGHESTAFFPDGSHARPLSFGMDLAGDDLNAQAPQLNRPQPFIKMEYEDMNLDCLPAVPFAGPVNMDAQAAALAEKDVDMSAGGADKKRKIEQVSDDADKDDSTATATGNSKSKTPAARKNSTASKRRQSASSADKATDAKAAKPAKDASPEKTTDAAAEEAVDGGEDDTASSPAKAPAPKAKKPPPSASQITESGKPFPVIDTSATHSSLFVPPDTSGLTKREARLVKNRAAAFLSRQRKREQFELLEKQCKSICRLTWRMWESLAGADAEMDKADKAVLESLLSNEGGDVRECLEQIVANKGASIAPTEESIANGTHRSREDSETPATSENASTSPAGSKASSSGAADASEKKPAVDVAAPKPASSSESDELKSLRSKLQAAAKRESDLREALQLAQSKAQSHSESSGSSPASSDWANSSTGDFAAVTAPTGVPAPFFVSAKAEQDFHEGPSGSGISPAVAPNDNAEKAEALVEVEDQDEATAEQEEELDADQEAEEEADQVDVAIEADSKVSVAVQHRNSGGLLDMGKSLLATGRFYFLNGKSQ